MVEDIGQILKQKLVGALYVDRLSGVVSVLEEVKKNRDQKTFIHKIPISCDVDSINCGEENSRYKDLIPDSKKRSVIFFEDISGASIIGRDRYSTNFRTDIRLISWVNYQLLAKNDCNITGHIINDIINRIQTTNRINSSPYLKIKISVLKVVQKTPAIFSRYTFPLTQSQYLMYPFDYFAIDFRVDFNMNPTCLDDYIIGTIDECNIV